MRHKWLIRITIATVALPIALFMCWLLSWPLAVALQGGLRLRQTPLQVAIEAGNSNEVERLLAIGADVNAVNSNGENSLFTALNLHQFDLADRLLERGASATMTNNAGYSVRDLADDEVLAWLNERGL